MFRVLCTLALLLFSPLSLALSYTLEITEQELQEKITAMMPVEKKKFFVTVKAFDPTIDLIQESNEIGVFVNIEAIAPGGFTGSGRAKVKGGLRYDKTKGTFYLDNPTIVSMELDKTSEKLTLKIREISQLALTKVLSIHPVYKFKDDNLKDKLAKAALESVIVKNQKLLVTLSVF